MKKKKKIIIITTIVLSILIFLTLTYNSLILNSYVNNNFNVDYDKTWTEINKSKNHILLKNNNGSTINITSSKYKKKTSKEEAYLNIHKYFVNNNKEYNLINKKEVIIGKNYIKGYSLLYESNIDQSLLYIIYKDNYIIQINYTALTQYFDLDLEKFYNVVNTIEV